MPLKSLGLLAMTATVVLVGILLPPRGADGSAVASTLYFPFPT